MVTFSIGTKERDGDLLPGSSKMWVSIEKADMVADLAARLYSCTSAVPLPDPQRLQLTEYLGTSRVVDIAEQLTVSRGMFDTTFATLLNLTHMPIPQRLRKVIIALRHALPGPTACLGPSLDLKIVCLFPVSACETSRIAGHTWQFDSGFRTDGLFLWLGQQQRKGHLEVLEALEDCCGIQQAVLVFTRRKQKGSPHTFIGRARGYLPVAAQISEARQPYRAALLLDTKSIFEMHTDDGYRSLAPGWKSPGPLFNKKSIHSFLGLAPAGRYVNMGYSLSLVKGSCKEIATPLSLLYNIEAE